jgi:tetratricopeptide (TPR) repeat protein
MSSSQASPTRPVAAPPQSEAYVLSLLSEGRFDVALEVIPEFGDGRVYWPDFHNYAQRLLASGKLEAAAAALDAAISLDPGRPQAYETLGELRLRQGRWPEAEESFRRALALAPKSSTARYGMGRALRQQGKRRQALEALVAAMEANPRQEWTGELQRALRRGNARVEAQGLAPLRDRAQRAIDRLRAVAPRPSAQPTISVCMIVRDEQDSLGRCLESVRKLANEIIVVDTGSEDATVEIAQSCGARIHRLAWCDDFSAARNDSLRHATCNWILVLDADDELGNAAGLKEYLATATDVKVCTVRTRIPHREKAGETIVEHPRLFRNHCGFHYRGPVHEQLCDAMGNPAAADAALDLAVYHHGYLEPEAEQDKRHRRNLHILHAWVERSPQDPWAQLCLGQAYYTNGEMERAIPPLLAALEHSAPDRAYRPKAYAYLASAHIAGGRPEQAERVCSAALEEFPGQAELLFCLGHAHERQGRVDDAIAAYEQATRGRFGPMLAYHDFTCRDLKPLARLAEIHASRGEFDQAQACLVRIERIRGGVPALDAVRERIASLRRLARQAGTAQGAVAAARDASEQDAANPLARVRLAALLLGAGNSSEAQEHVDAALELDPACAQALNLKGVLLCAHGKHGAAAEHFQRAAALRPDYADALCNLGAVRLRANDPDRAQAAFRQALEADATCFAAHLALGEIAQTRGDDQTAIASYEAAIRADAEEPAAWLGLARSYMRSQAYEPAARCYAKAAEVSAGAPHVLAEIAQVRKHLCGLSPTPA